MEARVTAHSQAYRLRERMEQGEVGHGQEIRADLTGIGVVAMARNWFAAQYSGEGEVLFCTMGPIRVREIVTPGDGRPLPTNAIVEGLVVPRTGTYDILNALVQANGDLRLIVDEETRVVPVVTGRETGLVAT
jgi:hypothetical protein